jgi:hypothetical protein
MNEENYVPGTVNIHIIFAVGFIFGMLTAYFQSHYCSEKLLNYFKNF